MPWQGTEKGVHTVDRLDPGREAQTEDGFLEPDGLVFHFVPILIHKYDDAGEIPDSVVVFLDAGVGFIGIVGHVLCFLVDAGHPAGYHVHDPVELLPPFAAVSGDVGKGGLFAEEDEPRIPAVVEVEIRQCRKDTRRGHGGKTFNGYDLNEFTPHFGDDAAPELLTTE